MDLTHTEYSAFLAQVLTNVGRLPMEIVLQILYRYGGLASPTALAWHTAPGHTERLAIHRDLVAHRAVGASESRCWCADFSISSLLAELHAFGTPHQSALSRTAALHSAPLRAPDNFAAYRKRCALASLLTRVATADAPHLASRVPRIQPRIGHDTSHPFLPVSHRFAVSGILPWFVRAGIPVTIADPKSVPALIREYYAH